MSPSSFDAPLLEQPGAGVPWAERMFLRWYMRPFVSERANWEDTAARFAATTKKIEDEIVGLSDEDISKQILIPPMSGLEDSSRYWSIAMTLEHIVIVGRGMTGIVKSLAAGKVPPGRANTATVKPTGGYAPKDAISAFRQFSGVEFPALLPSLASRDSKAVFIHPWFGAMTARGWYWLLATHHGLHLRQIREIKARLSHK